MVPSHQDIVHEIHRMAFCQTFPVLADVSGVCCNAVSGCSGNPQTAEKQGEKASASVKFLMNE